MLRAEQKAFFSHVPVESVSNYILDHCHQHIETYVSSIVPFGVCDACPNSASAWLLPHLQLFTQLAFLQHLMHV